MNQPGKAVTAKQEKKLEIRAVETELKMLRSRLIDALPAHIPVQLFTATVLTACAVEPKLLTCDRHSLFLSALKAARDGLLPDGREAALVPFRDGDSGGQVVTYIPMYAGLLKKVRNSGELASLTANAIYENDKFEYTLGDDEKIVHVPARTSRGKLVGAYAIAKTKDGGIYRRVLMAEDIEQIKKFSKAKKGPWHGTFESEMWVKTAIRRLAKILPQSTDIDHYLQAGPPLPATDAALVLPAASGEEAMQLAEFDLRTRAMTTLRDESETLDQLCANWEGIKAEYTKLGAELPLEVEDVFKIREEQFKEKAAA